MRRLLTYRKLTAVGAIIVATAAVATEATAEKKDKDYPNNAVASAIIHASAHSFHLTFSVWYILCDGTQMCYRS